jgi:hypothetical protein
MARTDADLVATIIEVDEDIDLDAFITTANELVTEVCTGDKGPTPAYTDVRLELIERWLAAHAYAIREMIPASERAGPVATAYQYEVGLHLSNTMYGQQALTLDTNGGLASLSKSTEEGKLRTAGVIWLGTEPC